jgi:hypothetical protein
VLLESNPSTIFSNDCSKSFTTLKGIGRATCQPEQSFNPEALSYSYLVTINQWSLIPYENNLFFHDGNPDIDEFKCDVDLLDQSVITKPYCEITDVVNSNLPGHSSTLSHLLLLLL